MKTRLILILAASISFGAPAFAKSGGHSHKTKDSDKEESGKESHDAVHIKGYKKKDATHVAPHDRTAPNHSKSDN